MRPNLGIPISLKKIFALLDRRSLNFFRKFSGTSVNLSLLPFNFSNIGCISIHGSDLTFWLFPG